MIKLQDLTPSVYYDQSRDFQFIGRLYDVVLNSIKTNVDMIYSVPSAEAAGSKMIDLLALTLGFRARHHYNVKQLAAICSIFPTILRNKGNIQAVLLIGQALLNSEGLTDAFGYTIDDADPFTIQLFVPPGLSDINLLLDLLPYVLPAGMVSNVVRAVSAEKTASTLATSSDKITLSIIGNINSKSQLYTATEHNSLGPTDDTTTGVITNAAVYSPGAADSSAESKRTVYDEAADDEETNNG